MDIWILSKFGIILFPKSLYPYHVTSTHYTLSERVDTMIYKVWLVSADLTLCILPYMAFQVGPVHCSKIQIVFKMKAFVDHIIRHNRSTA